jgi:hypothetical protein
LECLEDLSLGQDATTDIHRLQFLEKEFVGIGDFNRREVGCIATAFALPDTLLGIRNSKETTITTAPAAE